MGKRNVVLLLAAFACISVFAQNGTHYLKSITSEVEPSEYEQFYYNSEDKVDSLDWSNLQAEGSCSFVYDAMGNLVRHNIFQILNYKNSYVSYIDYEYDEDGNLVKRTNYNDYTGNGDNMVRGGVIEYTYEDGHLVKETTFVDWYSPGTLEVYSYVDYIYSDDGKLESEVAYLDDGFGSLAINSQVDYFYDGQGRISEAVTSFANYGTLTEQSKVAYVFDDNGDLVERTSYQKSGGWFPATSTYFVYDISVDAENVVYPYDNEDMYTDEVYKMSAHKLVRDTTYSEFEGDWGLYDIQNYNYEIVEPAGISEVKTERLSMNVSGGMLYLAGVQNGTSVCIYDSAGRLVRSMVYNGGGIPVEGLPEGVKIVKAGNMTGKFI